MKFDRTKLIEALRRVVQRMHYPLEVMLVCVRWYAAYPLSFRNIEEMMAERGVFVDHSTLHRWSMKMLPVLAAAFRRRKRPTWSKGYWLQIPTAPSACAGAKS